MLRFANRNLIVLAVTDMLGNLVRTMVFPYLSLYVLALGGNAESIGLVGMMTLAFGLLLLPIAGVIADRVNRMHMLVSVGLVSLLFQMMNVFAPDWRWLAVASFLSGMVVINFPAYSSLIADSLHEHGRGRGIAMMNIFASSLMIAGPFLAGAIILRMGTLPGMRLLWGVLVAVYFISSMIQLAFLREPEPEGRTGVNLPEVVRSLGSAFRSIPGMVRGMNPSLRSFWGVIVVAFVAQALTGNYLVVFATTVQGLNTEQWGLILLIESLLKWVLFFPAGMLIDRLGRRGILIFSFLLYAITLPLFWLARGFEMTMLVRLIQAVGFALSMPAAVALMADLTPRQQRGRLMAALGNGGIMLGGVGNPGGPALGYLSILPVMLASYAGGLIYSWSVSLPWFLASLCGLAGAWLVYKGIGIAPRAEVAVPSKEGKLHVN